MGIEFEFMGGYGIDLALIMIFVFTRTWAEGELGQFLCEFILATLFYKSTGSLPYQKEPV